MLINLYCTGLPAHVSEPIVYKYHLSDNKFYEDVLRTPRTLYEVRVAYPANKLHRVSSAIDDLNN